MGGEERYIHFVSTAMGQGAEAALPILALYMQQVYKDSSLPYSQSTKFSLPKDFNPCRDELSGGYWGGGGGSRGGDTGVDVTQQAETMEGVFD